MSHDLSYLHTPFFAVPKELWKYTRPSDSLIEAKGDAGTLPSLADDISGQVAAFLTHQEIPLDEIKKNIFQQTDKKILQAILQTNKTWQRLEPSNHQDICIDSPATVIDLKHQGMDLKIQFSPQRLMGPRAPASCIFITVPENASGKLIFDLPSLPHHLHVEAYIAASSSLELVYRVASTSEQHRIETYAHLCGTAADFKIKCAYRLVDQQVIDQVVSVEHLAPSTTSEQRIGGAVSDHAKAFILSHVKVHRAAQKTVAKQSLQHLLLSSTGKVRARPQLEIEADDVKCQHGASIGSLREEEIFYLRSRGIGADEAKSLLIDNFIKQIAEVSS